jgi:DNA-binding NtrC family response regulator
VQVKILRVLETGKFLRVGGSRELNVNVRVLAATNKDLQYEAAQGHFRQDLFYRLKAVNIIVPPLRERVEDIPMLINRFAKEFSEKNNRPEVTFDNEAIDIMRRNYWAGNVRELKNFVESMIALSHEGVISANNVGLRLGNQTTNRNLPILVNRPAVELNQELVYRTLLELRHEMNGIKGLLQQLLLRQETGEKRTEEIDYYSNSHFQTAEEVEVYTLNEMEKEQIRRALSDFNGNRRQVAEALGIGERTLYRKIKQYRLK